MPSPLTRKITLADFQAARGGKGKMAMLTCYDFTTARLMQEAGVPSLLVGDSAANVILGFDSTLPVSLRFMIDISAAVRRGAPLAYVVADMPFGSYHASEAQAVRNVTRVLQLSGCDCVKLEVTARQGGMIRRLADAGVAVMAHIGLRPQSAAVLGGYKFQGRTADKAQQIVDEAVELESAGAVAILLEAVPPQVAQAVVDATKVPIIGCGAGPACHGFVFVTHDAIGLTPKPPRFAPKLGDLATPMKQCFADYVNQVAAGTYPADIHNYEMSVNERMKLEKGADSL